MEIDVLVVVPPLARPKIRRRLSTSYPGTSLPVDSVPLRLCSVLERDGYKVGYLPLYNYLLDFSSNRDAEIAASFLRNYDFECLFQITDYHIPARSTPCFPSMILLSNLAKMQNPNAKVILGGNHVSIRPHEPFEKSKNVDVVAVLESEPHVSQLIESLQKDHLPEDIPGIVYRNKEGHVKQNEGYGIVRDLDWLPPPSYHLLKPHLEGIHLWTKRTSNQVDLSLRTSYGCVHQCAFCSHTQHYNDYRMRSAEKIKEDIECARKTLPDTAVFTYFDDELITYNREHLHDLGKIMEELDMKVWGSLTSAHFFNEEIAQDMSRICTMVLFGAENANDMILRSLKKPIKFSKTVEACRIAVGHGLDTLLFWMVGLPGENKSIMLENLNALHSLIMKGYAKYVQLLVFMPYPGSEIYKNPQEYGITIHHEHWEEYDEDGGYPVHNTAYLSRKDIFIYYLLSQMVINEASTYRQTAEKLNLHYEPEPGDAELFEEFLNSDKEGDI